MQMIDTLARFAGRAIRGLRAGEETLAKNVLRAPENVEVRSDSFGHGEPIPPEHSDSEGHNASPAISWSDVPLGTKEVVLLCEDPDIPMRKPFPHWVVYGIGPSVHSLPAGIAPGAQPGGGMQGKNAMRRDGYLGPHPPKGHGPHRYHFELFALDRPLRVGPRATRDEIVTAMRGHVIGCGDLVGTYTR